MLTFYLGPDDYSKKQLIKTLVKEKGADLVMFREGDELPNESRLLETDLFSRLKVFVFDGIMPVIKDANTINSSKNSVIVCLNTIDKRKKENKDLFAKFETKDFVLPHGKALDKWLVEFISSKGGKISPEAANELAVRLGRDAGKETKVGGKIIAVEEVFNLWQAASEAQKLLAYCQGGKIEKADVENLVNENGEVDALQITNAIAEKNKILSFSLIHKFLQEQTASDEKGSIILLNALLSEQFRNILLCQDFMANKQPEDEILEQTGWKPGRLFVMKKISAKFTPSIISETLKKLAALDEEMKSGSTPPKVLLDLIVSQILA